MRIAWECPKGHWTLPNPGFSRPQDHRPRHCERCYREWIRATFPVGWEPFDIDQRFGIEPSEQDVANTAPPGQGHYWVSTDGEKKP